jgi:hypothetical protein
MMDMQAVSECRASMALGEGEKPMVKPDRCNAINNLTI